MRRVLIEKPGGFDRLRVVAGELPKPGPDEVRVQVEAIGVNFADCVVRMGLYRSAKQYVGWPITPGFEFAGTAVEVGEKVEGLSPGAPVFGLTRFGAYQTEVVVDRRLLFGIPDRWTPEQAGAFPVAFLTAWYALREMGNTRPGARVLIHSAAGGVGLAAVQIAKLLGAHVTGVVGGAHKVEVAHAFGCDVVIDKAGDPRWQRDARLEPGYDVVLDPNGQSTLKDSYARLRPTGRLVIYGFQSMLPKGRGRESWLKLLFTYLRTPRFDPMHMTDTNRSVMAFNLSYLFDHLEQLERAMTELLDWATQGKLRPLPIEAHAFDDVAEAHRRLQSGTTTGRLVLTTEHASPR